MFLLWLDTDSVLQNQKKPIADMWRFKLADMNMFELLYTFTMCTVPVLWSALFIDVPANLTPLQTRPQIQLLFISSVWHHLQQLCCDEDFNEQLSEWLNLVIGLACWAERRNI